MIKNLLNADQDPPPGTKVIIEETVIDPLTEINLSESTATDEPLEIPATHAVFEIPETATFFAKPSEARDEARQADEILELPSEPLIETKNEDLANSPPPEKSADSPNIGQLVDEKTNDDLAAPLFQSVYKPETPAENIRQSGLAYSAAIILFASVVFMLILGWFADLLLGSSPWGIVGGIILGALIGFVQFFRITSQIFRK